MWRIICFFYFINLSSIIACSPYAVPTLSNQQIVGTDLILNWTSNIPWACTYKITTEVSCQSGTRLLPLAISAPIVKNSTSSQAYPSAQVIDISSLCKGEVYRFRAKDGGSGWTQFYEFTIGDVFEINVTPIDPILCIGDCIDLTASTPEACNQVFYTWSNGLGSSSTISVCPAVTTTYTVTALTNGLCGPITSSQDVTVEVVEYPIGGEASSFPEHVCEGDPSRINLVGYHGNIQWQSSLASNGPWTNLVGETADIHIPISTMVDVYYRAELTNYCGLEHSTVAMVYAEPYPQMQINVQNGCIYDPIVFENQSTIATGNIVNWIWDFGDFSSGFSANESHLYDRPGTYNIKLTATSDYECISEITSQVTVNPSPVANFTRYNDCQYNEISFEDQSYVDNPDNIITTIYDFGDQSAFVSGNSPSHLYNNPGNYNVTMIVTTNNGCADNITLPIEIYPVPVASFSANIKCENAEATNFTNLSSINSGQISLYDWSFGDNNTSTFPNPSNNYSSDGVYLAQLIVHSNYNCTDTTEIPITVLKKPSTYLMADTPESCSPLCVNFTDHSISNASNIVNYYWKFGNGEESYDQNPNSCFYNSDNTEDISFDVQLITQNDLGCYDTLLLEDYLNVFHNPVASFIPVPEEKNMYHPEIEFENYSVGAEEYVWRFEGGKYSYDYEPYNVFPDTGLYTVELVAITDKNCKDTTYRNVKILPTVSLYIPNAFTPDGDGVNDVAMYKGYGIVDYGFNFYVFDRWGTLIFYSNDKAIGWDGIYKGEVAQEDTYLYRIECLDIFGESHTKKGHINLLK